MSLEQPDASATEPEPQTSHITEVEAWLGARRGQRLVVTLRDSATGSFFIRRRGVLRETIREDDDGCDYMVELRLEGGQEVVLHAQLIDGVEPCHDPSSVTGGGLTIVYHGGNVDLEVDA